MSGGSTAVNPGAYRHVQDVYSSSSGKRSNASGSDSTSNQSGICHFHWMWHPMDCSMKTRITAYAATLLVVLSFADNAIAADVTGYSGGNLNIRSGSSSRFPQVGVLGAGSELRIHGCVARFTWCDVSASGVRGWVSGAHIQFIYEARRVYVPAYAALKFMLSR